MILCSETMYCTPVTFFFFVKLACVHFPVNAAFKPEKLVASGRSPNSDKRRLDILSACSCRPIEVICGS